MIDCNDITYSLTNSTDLAKAGLTSKVVDDVPNQPHSTRKAYCPASGSIMYQG